MTLQGNEEFTLCPLLQLEETQGLCSAACRLAVCYWYTVFSCPQKRHHIGSPSMVTVPSASCYQGLVTWYSHRTWHCTLMTVPLTLPAQFHSPSENKDFRVQPVQKATHSTPGVATLTHYAHRENDGPLTDISNSPSPRMHRWVSSWSDCCWEA